MTSIIEKQGSGWDKINGKEFFKCSEVYRREDVNMSTTKEYEECNIMFSTMHSIRKTVKNTFEIQCVTDKYQVSNHSVRERHPGMFRDKYHHFFPTNDLVKSMPYNFVNSLKDEKLTKLENKWLTDVKKTLKQAESNSIKIVKLVRTIMKSDLPLRSLTS